MTQPNKKVSAELSLDLAERLRRVVGNFVRAVRARSDTPTTARSETLALLDRGGAMSTAKLAEQRSVKHQSMRLVVEQLEKEGLIEKMLDTRDRRSQLVTITLRGRTTLSEGRQSRAEWIARAIDEQITTEERKTLESAIVLLDRIAAAAP